MMKWKVVKNPRSLSADRSLESLKKDAQWNNNDSNNNVGEEGKENQAPPPKETNKQRASSLVRKPSGITTECINLRSILGLTRQRSETNLSNLGLIGSEPRRSRSEVRGVSCDRLTVGYLSPPAKPLENGKTRSSSPPSRSGWLMRGRKRERESRNSSKNCHQEVLGKTVVSGSNRKRTSSKSQNGDCRTILDGSDNCKLKNSALEPRKCRGRRKSQEDIIEEDMYAEINLEDVHGKLLEQSNKETFKDHKKVINLEDVRGKLLEESNKETSKDHKKVVRKKGLAPKPQITKTIFKDVNGDVNVNGEGRKTSGSPTSLKDVPDAIANRKPPRKNQTFSGRNTDRKSENRVIQTVKLNNFKNNEIVLVKTNNINVQSVVAVAEIHEELIYLSMDNVNKNTVLSKESTDSITLLQAKEPVDNKVLGADDDLPFHIDTPDYSTLESVNSENFENIPFSKEDIINCNLEGDDNQQESRPSSDSDNVRVSFESSLSSILRDTTEEQKTDSESKKTVRFEKLDLIEKYKKHKTDSCMDTEEDVPPSDPESKSALDVNSNEINEQKDLQQSTDKPDIAIDANHLTVNVVVRNPSPIPDGEESPNQFVAKKSFVLTVAKQEKGFKSLCANKKTEPVMPQPMRSDQQISVTFLCSEVPPPADGWQLPDDGLLRLRSTSVPPVRNPVDVVAALPLLRGRSRERKSKERHHGKKNKARKKDAVFVMPQAVIDELSQVLEKRKPSAPLPRP